MDVCPSALCVVALVAAVVVAILSNGVSDYVFDEGGRVPRWPISVGLSTRVSSASHLEIILGIFLADQHTANMCEHAIVADCPSTPHIDTPSESRRRRGPLEVGGTSVLARLVRGGADHRILIVL